MAGAVVPLQTAFARGYSNNEYNDKTYLEITGMLEGGVALPVKRAVFLAEQAYLDGNPDYGKDFCEPVRKAAGYMKRMTTANHWEK